ncbi:MAG: hypothetical protein AAF380_02155 [Bacteroidota bacterium]
MSYVIKSKDKISPYIGISRLKKTAHDILQKEIQELRDRYEDILSIEETNNLVPKIELRVKNFVYQRRRKA